MGRKKKTNLDRVVEENIRAGRGPWDPGTSPIAKEKEKKPINPVDWWVAGIVVVVAGVLVYIYWDKVVEIVSGIAMAIFMLWAFTMAMKDNKGKPRRRK